MVPLFGAILCSPESMSGIDLVTARLKLEGLPAYQVNSKHWKDDRDGIRIFTKPSPSLAKELLDWSIEPLLYGKFTDSEKESYIDAGVSLLWEKEIEFLFEMPIFMMKQGPCYWSICTSNPVFDKHLAIILKSFGQLVSIEGEINHLIARLRTNPINIVMIDWDQPHLELQKNIAQLRKLRQEKEILFLGIKNFDKDNLYRDLAYGISEISPSLFPITEIIEIIVNSLPVSPKQNETPNKRNSFRKLEFDFQEKTKPTRYRLVDSFKEQRSDAKEEIQSQSLVSMYRWLFNRSFE
jgi:hypothetical protein